MPQNSECSEICDVRIPSVSFADSVPTPFGPSGHFPLIGGIGPLCPRGAFCSGEPPLAAPRAVRRRWHLRQQMTEGICLKIQSVPKFVTFASPQSALLTASLPLLALRAISP